MLETVDCHHADFALGRESDYFSAGTILKDCNIFYFVNLSYFIGLFVWSQETEADDFYFCDLPALLTDEVPRSL